MQSYVYVILLATVTFIGCSQDTDLSEMSKESLSGVPYQTTGFKVGEVTSTEAIIWARTTCGAVRVSA